MVETPGQAADRFAAPMLDQSFKFEALHVYTDINGNPLYYRIRLKHSKTGDKWIRPMSRNGHGWELKEPEFDGAKPLYGLHHIAKSPNAIVWVVEGEQKADALQKLGMLATTSGSATSAKATDWEPLRGRTVRIWPDNDEPGKGYAQDVATILQNLGGSASCIDTDQLGLAPGEDVIQWLKEHPWDNAPEIEALPLVTVTCSNSTNHNDPLRRFKLVRFSNAKFQTAGAYLVKGLIPASGLVIVWGPPKCGKSFWSMDLGLHVAFGWDYRGHRVIQGSVVYIALEGSGGYAARIEAFRREHDLAAEVDPDFYLLPANLNLVADCDQLIAAIRSQLNGANPACIFIDTLNRSIAGSESNDRDMGDYIKAADAVIAAFGCAVVIVHHCGINDSRPRGHTSLTGAADAQLAVKRDGSGTITVTLEWLKDGQEGSQMTSRLKQVDLGQDDDGDPITSCVIEATEADNTERSAPTRKLNDRQKLAVDALQDVVIKGGEPVPAAFRLPAEVRAVPVPVWREELVRRGTLDPKSTNPRQDFKRLKEALQARYIIAIRDELVWLVSKTQV